ncbi:MAG TPA: hypothetical protein EYQ39_09210 [Gemmatimonadetes bacterium]|nr:hypothetical protein [Gemmatimonadota bacterium]
MRRRGRGSRWLTAFGVLLAISTFAACQESVSGLDHRIDGITYRVTSFAIADSFPVQLRISVEIENESTTSQSVTFPDGCVVLVRAYDGGTKPVWDMGLTVGCTQALVQVFLAPRESAEFHTGLVSAATILGDSLPNGEYRITAYLRPGQMVELDAGMANLAVP